MDETTERPDDQSRGKLRKVDPASLDLTKWSKLMPPSSSRSNEEYRRLRDNIREYGQQQPIEVYEGGVVDGVQRALILQELSERAVVRFLPAGMFRDEAEIERYILRQQLGRRNLNDTGWNRCLAKLYQIERGAGVSRREFVKQKAEEYGVTRRAIEDAIAKGAAAIRVAPEIKARLKTVCDSPQAAIDLLAQLPPDKQAEIVQANDTQRTICEAAKMAIRERAAAAVVSKASDVAESVRQEQVPQVAPPDHRAAAFERIDHHIAALLTLLHALAEEAPSEEIDVAVAFVAKARDAIAKYRAK